MDVWIKNYKGTKLSKLQDLSMKHYTRTVDGCATGMYIVVNGERFGRYSDIQCEQLIKEIIQAVQDQTHGLMLTLPGEE